MLNVKKLERHLSNYYQILTRANFIPSLACIDKSLLELNFSFCILQRKFLSLLFSYITAFSFIKISRNFNQLFFPRIFNVTKPKNVESILYSNRIIYHNWYINSYLKTILSKIIEKNLYLENIILIELVHNR